MAIETGHLEAKLDFDKARIVIDGLPEEISFEAFKRAHEALGIPFGAKITEVRLIPGSVEVTFLRRPSNPKHPDDILLGGSDSIAKITVPIRVRVPKACEHRREDAAEFGNETLKICTKCGLER